MSNFPITKKVLEALAQLSAPVESIRLVSQRSNPYPTTVPHQVLTVSKQLSLYGSKWVIDSSDIKEAKSIQTSVVDMVDTELMVKD